MIGETARSTSFSESAEYVLNLKQEHRQLPKAERAKSLPSLSVTADAPAWKADCRHRIIGGNMSGETEQELNREFAAIRKLRPDIKNQLLCVSIRKAQNDIVTAEQWRDIAEQTVEGLGLQGCAYTVVQHRDKGTDKNDHIHILASLIRLDGKVVSDSQSYRKVERVMREMEAKHGLTVVESSRDSVNGSPTWIEHRRLTEDGTLSPKMELQARISRVLESKPTTTQFIHLLQVEHAVKVFPKLDADGFPQGIAFSFKDATMSGTTVGRGYRWKSLLERGLSFDEKDLEAVRQADDWARIERHLKIDEKISFDDELELAFGDLTVSETRIGEEKQISELKSEVTASEHEYAAARRVPTLSQAARTASSPENDPIPVLELAKGNDSHIAEGATAYDLPKVARMVEDLPPAPHTSAFEAVTSKVITDLVLPEPKATAADSAIRVEASLIEIQLNAVTSVEGRERDNDSQSASPAIDVTPETDDNSERDATQPAQVSRTPTLGIQTPPPLPRTVPPNIVEEIHPQFPQHLTAVDKLEGQETEFISTYQSENALSEIISIDTEPTISARQVNRENDVPVQSVEAANEHGFPPTEPATREDGLAANSQPQTIESSDVSTTTEVSRGVPSTQADIYEPTTLATQKASVEPVIRLSSEVDLDSNDLPPTASEITATKATYELSAVDVSIKRSTPPTVQPAQTQKQVEQLQLNEVPADATAPPPPKQVGEVMSEDANPIKNRSVVEDQPTFVKKLDGALSSSLPAPVEPEPLPSQPSPLSPTQIGATREISTPPQMPVDNEVDDKTKPAKTSFLKPIRDFFDPAVKEQKILDKYHAEREVAREHLKTFNGESILRAQAMLDKTIINSAHGQKYTPTSGHDLSYVLTNMHKIEEHKAGKNWMDVGKRVAQEERHNLVWKGLGQGVGIAAREAAQADKAEVRRRAYTTYEAKYKYAPHDAVSQIFERELMGMEQQPPSVESLELVSRLNKKLPANKQLPIPFTELEVRAMTCRKLKNGDDRALHLFEQVEREAVKELPAEKLAELKPFLPSNHGADTNDINYVTTHYPHIVGGARGWYKEATGKDFTLEQASVFIRTVWERANHVKPDAEELRAVRLLSLKRDMPMPQVQCSLDARVKCAELAGTDEREVWGQVAAVIRRKQDAIDAAERKREAARREREAAEQRQAEEQRRQAIEAAAKFKAALPNTPPTAKYLAPTTVKQIVELPPQREQEIAAKYAQPISFAEEQLRENGDRPSVHSRKALVTMLALHDELKPTTQTLRAYDYLHQAKGENAAPPSNEVNALITVNNLKDTSKQFWLDTGQAATAMGERIREVEEIIVAVTEVYRKEKGREPSESFHLYLRKSFILAADQPPSDEHLQRVAGLASDKGVPMPVFESAASASYWTMLNSPERAQKLLSVAETVESKIAERQVQRTFQLNPADPQQRAGVLFTEWMMQTVQLDELKNSGSRNAFEEQRAATETINASRAYVAASEQHETLYGVEPHPIMTSAQQTYLHEHKAALDWSQYAALNEAVIVGVSSAKIPLGKEPELYHSHSLSDDFSP
ncbi:MAG: relaxase/mobilization nuclease domain-containing protein [Pyrinomonadaceae bacterium MAG19_C2-C3]|nr:relaxase/mobilization nuclease domain-containing protein [Pyrinomonadaceae bacterium MAG19_C2-C3]